MTFPQRANDAQQAAAASTTMVRMILSHKCYDINRDFFHENKNKSTLTQYVKLSARLYHTCMYDAEQRH